eukprot:10300417-Alexandrium_andersonii.AAC.1
MGNTFVAFSAHSSCLATRVEMLHKGRPVRARCSVPVCACVCARVHSSWPTDGAGAPCGAMCRRVCRGLGLCVLR